jgi:hypothetical protein
MNREQLIDQIAAIDRQILQLTQPRRVIRGPPTEGDRIEHDRVKREVQWLAGQKTELRLDLVKC